MRSPHIVAVLAVCATVWAAGAGTVQVASADTVAGSSTTSTTVAETPATNLDSLPAANGYWPLCSSDSVTYCREAATIVNADGTESAAPGVTPYINCHTSGSPAGTCATDGSYWMEMGTNNLTAAELVNTYHWRVRTGKLSPDILMLGNTQRTKVSGSQATGWKLDIWAKPAVRAYKDGCWSPDTCGDTTVAESVTYGMVGYMRSLAIGTATFPPSVATTQLRDNLRGTFISTNGMSQSWDFTADTFRVSAVSPHFLTDGTTPSPGFVKVFLPQAYVLGDRGYASLDEVKPEDILLTVSNKTATASVTVMEGGLLVDTGVTHFSAPNPTVQIKKKAVATTTPAASTPASTSSNPAIKRGASKSLSSVYRAKAAQRAKWTASGACSIKGTKVVAKTRTGTCTVTVRVLNAKRKYVVAARTTFDIT